MRLPWAVTTFLQCLLGDLITEDQVITEDITLDGCSGRDTDVTYMSVTDLLTPDCLVSEQDGWREESD